ncbi:hypothetical protein [Flavobacterium sp. ZB4P13]|uniref:hypothetical protein n=1 Tax=Flavobacterium sp. ZB4P13 TaxID=3401728 RepID=UPI003AAED195
MNYFSKHNDTKKSNNTFMLLVIILLSNVAVFGQSTENNVAANATEVISVAKQENISTSTSSSSSMNFVLWFMGSKQDPNSTISTQGTNTKKQVITSGAAPNRLLIKTFLKKAVNLESMVA